MLQKYEIDFPHFRNDCHHHICNSVWAYLVLPQPCLGMTHSKGTRKHACTFLWKSNFESGGRLGWGLARLGPPVQPLEHHGTQPAVLGGHLSSSRRCCWRWARRSPWGSLACPPCSPTSSVAASTLTSGCGSYPLSMLSFGSVAWSLCHVIPLLFMRSVWNSVVSAFECNRSKNGIVYHTDCV